MPSANKTPNYGLNQWLGNEYPKRDDFVSDNAKIDTEINKVATGQNTPTITEPATLANIVSGDSVSSMWGKTKKAIAALIAHIANKDNPHGVTSVQSGAVPVTRAVNGKGLSADITLGAADVGAATASHTHTAAAVGAAAASHTHTANDVGAVPTARKVNGKELTADVSVTAQDAFSANANVTSRPMLAKGYQVKRAGRTQDGLGKSGYIKFARITINAAYVNTPIEFVVVQRSFNPHKVILRFPQSTSTDLNINDVVFCVESFAGTSRFSIVKVSYVDTQSETKNGWDLYIQKTDAYDDISVMSVNLPEYLDGKLSIEWTDEFVSQEAGLPGTAADRKKADVSVLNQESGGTGHKLGAVPPTRTINDKALSADITLAAADVGAAAASHAHAASDISSGTLPISRGGTGATTAVAGLTNLMSSTTGAFTVGGNSVGSYTNFRMGSLRILIGKIPISVLSTTAGTHISFFGPFSNADYYVNVDFYTRDLDTKSIFGYPYAASTSTIVITSTTNDAPYEATILAIGTAA